MSLNSVFPIESIAIPKFADPVISFADIVRRHPRQTPLEIPPIPTRA